MMFNSTSFFNKLQGRLRISVSHNCQMNCLFCHHEGIIDYKKDVYMSPFFFNNLIVSFINLGGKEVNITGEEPLMNPEISKILENDNLEQIDKVALCTNGLLINKYLNSLNFGFIDEIKVSLHSLSTNGPELLGSGYNAKKIINNIGLVRDLGIKTTINFTLTNQNFNDLPKILEICDKYRCNLLVIDPICSHFHVNDEFKLNIPITTVENFFTPYQDYLTINNQTGCMMKSVKNKNGNTITIKNIEYGRLFTAMCHDCKFQNNCGEGVFALRVDSRGVFKPCLLRQDLHVPISSSATLDEIQNVIESEIKIMFPNAENWHG